MPTADLFDQPAAETPTPVAPDRSAERLFLLDGMALAYRAYFAMVNRPLTTSSGEQTAGVFSFATSLQKILDDDRPDHIAVVFDTDQPTFRHAAFEHYKGHRPAMPDDLVTQIVRIKQLIRAYDIPVIERDGYEADDVIGTLARCAADDGAQVVIVTPDKDFCQLVTDRITLYRPGYRGGEVEVVDTAGVQARFGVPPEQVIDVLGLMGDAVDNVPGVPGIGEKTATKLIQEHGSVEAVLEAAPTFKQAKLRQNLTEFREQALLSKQLVTIDTAAPVSLDWHALIITHPNWEALDHLFGELEFRGFRRRLQERRDLVAANPHLPPHTPNRPAPPDPLAVTTTAAMLAAPGADAADLGFDFGPYTETKTLAETDHHYTTVRTAAELAELIGHLRQADRVSFDTETDGLEPLTAGLVGLSVSVAPYTGTYVPVPLPDGTDEAAILAAFGPILQNPAVTLCGQNLKFDLEVLGVRGIEPAGALFDTMVADYTLRPEGAHNLDALAGDRLKYKPIPITDLIGKGKSQITMRDVPLEQIAEYAAEDADVALRLHDVLKPELAAIPTLDELCRTVEFPLVPVLARMEQHGIAVDTEILGEISASLEAQLNGLERETYEAAGETFAIGSPKQLSVILFDKLKLPARKKTATGYSTDQQVLEDLSSRHPLPRLVLQYRQLSKLKSTYVDALPSLINPRTGRIHTSFNQTVAATGRLSSSAPNLQNIPVRTDQGREIRRAFIAGEPGWTLLAADYSQIELRILAHASKDAELVRIFNTPGEDIHTSTASRLFNVPPAEVEREQRRAAKTINFAVLYGISPFGLAGRLGINQAEAKSLIEAYFQQFPEVGHYFNRVLEEARRTGYVETLLGRRRYIGDLHARNAASRSFAERTAQNMPIQGTNADMIKLAMIAIDRRLREQGLAARMLLQVHDELLFEVPETEVEQVRALVTQEMRDALPLDVPIVIEIGTAPNWLDAH